MKSSNGRAGGPLALQNLTGACDFDCWTGGLVASSKAKLLDSIESVFHVPAAMLEDAGQNMYQQGVEFGAGAQATLFSAIEAYWREYSRDPGRKPKKDVFDEQRAHSRTVAASHFWTALEQGVPDLLAVVDKPEFLGADRDWTNTPWGKLVARTAAEAFRISCPSGTPRQMHAYSAALPRLQQNISNDAKETSTPKPKACSSICVVFAMIAVRWQIFVRYGLQPESPERGRYWRAPERCKIARNVPLRACTRCTRSNLNRATWAMCAAN